eukprot:gene220-biopygen19585
MVIAMLVTIVGRRHGHDHRLLHLLPSSSPSLVPPSWRSQDSQQACNAPTHHIAIQDTSLQWHSTLGLVPHLMGVTSPGFFLDTQLYMPMFMVTINDDDAAADDDDNDDGDGDGHGDGDDDGDGDGDGQGRTNIPSAGGWGRPRRKPPKIPPKK